jgi:uncharacterized phage-associated protein
VSNLNTDLDHLILRIVRDVNAQTGRPLHRTQLVKLVYLTDYIYSQHTGQTLTGTRYRWDRYGPNAKGNQIVIKADMLAEADRLKITEDLTPGGSFKFLYEPGPFPRAHRFDVLAEAIITKVIQDYGRLSWKEITEESKKTKPFRTAKSGEDLDLSPDQAMLDEVRELSQQMAKEPPPRRGVLVSLRDLKARYGG